MPSGRRPLLSAGVLSIAALAAGCVELSGRFGPEASPGPDVRRDPAQPLSVGLLVPGSGVLSADWSAAARLAADALADRAPMDLAVFPTGPSDGGAVTAGDAALAAGVDVIVGPAFGATAVAKRARRQSVPVFALSEAGARSERVAGTLYHLDPGQGAAAAKVLEALAGFGVARAVVLAPQGPVGTAEADAVVKAAPRFGVEVGGAGRYPQSAQAMVERAPAIGATIRDANASVAIFTGAPSGSLAFLAETLRAQPGLAPLQFAGLSDWSLNRSLLGQPALQGAIFAGPAPELSRAFRERFVAATGRQPHPRAGLAFDAVAAIGALVVEARETGVATPFQPRRIAAPSGFVGVGGPFRFDRSGANDRALAIFQATRGQAVVVEPAPDRFGEETPEKENA